MLAESIERDGTYWLPGDIVLIARGIGFRVHMDKLAGSSNIFQELFANSQPDEVIENCPVMVVDDDPDHWRAVFLVLYGVNM